MSNSPVIIGLCVNYISVAVIKTALNKKEPTIMGFWYQKAFTVKELLQKALVVIVTNKFHPVTKAETKM